MGQRRYIKKKGFFTWEELGYISKALGFPGDTFYKCIPEEYTRHHPGVSMQTMEVMTDHYKYFNSAVDRTFNLHSDEWNLAVLRKALFMFSARILSLEELCLVRMAYQVYEEGDTKGMLLDQHVLLRALKLCGYMISPLKMQHRLKHMQRDFEETGRIQLHEFLDLLCWCEPYVEPNLPKPDLETSKDTSQLFRMEDFEEFLSHHDARQLEQLDKKYKNKELKFTRVKHDVKNLPRDVPPVNTEIRKQLAGYHGQRYGFLSEEVDQSQGRLHQARAGYVRQRPLTAPDLTMHQAVDPSVIVSALDGRPETVYEMAKHLIQQPNNSMTESDPQDVCLRPVSDCRRTKIPRIVSPQEILQTRESLEALKFEMETVEMKYRHMVREDLEFLLPGFHERHHSRSMSEPTPTTSSLQRPLTPKHLEPHQCLSPEQLPSPPPVKYHSKTCDARHRGWQTVQTKPGPHLVLVAPTFGNSQTGQLFAKMHHHSLDQAGRGKWANYLYRFTRQSQIPKKSRKCLKIHPLLSKSSQQESHGEEKGMDKLNVGVISQASLDQPEKQSSLHFNTVPHAHNVTNLHSENTYRPCKESQKPINPKQECINGETHDVLLNRISDQNETSQIPNTGRDLYVSDKHPSGSSVISADKTSHSQKVQKKFTHLSLRDNTSDDCVAEVMAKTWVQEPRQRQVYERLIGRMENNISQNMKLKLLSGKT